jgi:hypothetical protein
VTRQKTFKLVVAVDSVRMALFEWRQKMKAKHWPNTSMWGPQAILNDNTCELLASIGPVESKAFLASVFKASWAWWDKLGDELFSFLCNLDIPPLPQTLRGTKQQPLTSAQNPVQLSTDHMQRSPTKRPRTA